MGQPMLWLSRQSDNGDSVLLWGRAREPDGGDDGQLGRADSTIAGASRGRKPSARTFQHRYGWDDGENDGWLGKRPRGDDGGLGTGCGQQSDRGASGGDELQVPAKRGIKGNQKNS